MLYWAGTKPSLLVLLGSPVIGLVFAFSTVPWGAWIIVLLALLLWWRPYVWEGLAVMLGNVLMGVVAVPFWGRLAPYQQNRLLAFLNPEVDPRATGWHVIQSKIDRKSTRLNSSHGYISYAVFCLKKKNKHN